MGMRTLATVAAVGAVAVGAVAAPGPSARTRVTVWSTSSSTGGAGYGGAVQMLGAMVTEVRDVDVSRTGEIRLPGVAATLDPGSVQLRDLSDPTATVTQQRFLPGATTPTEILARHLGDPVTVVTTKGEVAGTLRSADEQVLVVEVGTGDQRRLQLLRRDGYVLDVRVPAGAALDRPTLAWQVATKQPGTHSVEVSYRAEGLQWTADYLAVLDATGKTADFSAWATVHNASGATFERAELTLVQSVPVARGRAAPASARFTVPSPVRLADGQAVQVELAPARQAAKAHTVITYEAIPDQAETYQAYPNTDCSQFAGTPTLTGTAQVAIELEVASGSALPPGRVRTFRRLPDRLEVIGEEPLESSAGHVRVRIAPAPDVTGERLATCTYDERGKTITEKVTVKLENRSKQAADVVLREFLWRWPIARIDSEDTHGVRTAPQTQEYRVALAAGGKRSVSYTVSYTTW